MSWRKFDTIYVNGCSHTAGGGLYDDETKELYEEIYGLTSQIRRCAVSIPSNIAEGSGRGTKKEFNKFLNISLGS